MLPGLPVRQRKIRTQSPYQLLIVQHISVTKCSKHSSGQHKWPSSNSILTQSALRSCEIPRLGLSSQDSLASNGSSKPLVVACVLDLSATNWGSHNLLFGFMKLTKPFTHIYLFIIKDGTDSVNEHQMGRCRE